MNESPLLSNRPVERHSSVARTVQFLLHPPASYRLDADSLFIEERRRELDRIGARMETLRSSTLVAKRPMVTVHPSPLSR